MPRRAADISRDQIEELAIILAANGIPMPPHLQPTIDPVRPSARPYE